MSRDHARHRVARLWAIAHRLAGVCLLVVLWPHALTVATAQQGTAPASPALVERTALDGQVTLLTPQDFRPMSEDMLALKYPSVRPPKEVLTNERGSINIAFNHTDNAMRPDQVAAFHPALERMFRNLYPSARWNRSEVVTRDGQACVVLDLWTPAVDTEVRNLMLATSVEGRLLIVSFNVTRELDPEWGPLGVRIMESVRVRR